MLIEQNPNPTDVQVPASWEERVYGRDEANTLLGAGGSEPGGASASPAPKHHGVVQAAPTLRTSQVLGAQPVVDVLATDSLAQQPRRYFGGVQGARRDEQRREAYAPRRSESLSPVCKW